MNRQKLAMLSLLQFFLVIGLYCADFQKQIDLLTQQIGEQNQRIEQLQKQMLENAFQYIDGGEISRQLEERAKRVWYANRFEAAIKLGVNQKGSSYQKITLDGFKYVVGPILPGKMGVRKKYVHFLFVRDRWTMDKITFEINDYQYSALQKYLDAHKIEVDYMHQRGSE